MEIGTLMARRIIWNGSPDEALALLQALTAHCTCHIADGRILAACPGHMMLAHDQRAIDGLLFMRRLAARLLAEEFDVEVGARQSGASASNLSSAILT
jgi:hypothetical protein